MKLFPATTFLSLFLISHRCLAAGPLVLPNFLSAVSTGYPALSSASTKLPNASSPLNLLSNYTSLASISGLSVLPKPKPRPEDPSEFEVPGTSLTLEFSHYGEGVPAGQTMLVFLKALMQAFDKILAFDRDVPLNEDEKFEEIMVYMIVLGRRRMTYAILRAAIGSIVGFMIEYGTFGVQDYYSVLESGWRDASGRESPGTPDSGVGDMARKSPW